MTVTRQSHDSHKMITCSGEREVCLEPPPMGLGRALTVCLLFEEERNIALRFKLGLLVRYSTGSDATRGEESM